VKAKLPKEPEEAWLDEKELAALGARPFLWDLLRIGGLLRGERVQVSSVVAFLRNQPPPPAPRQRRRNAFAYVDAPEPEAEESQDEPASD
jgi:hypothetical protein